MLKDKKSYTVDNCINSGGYSSSTVDKRIDNDENTRGICQHSISSIKRVFRALPDAILCVDCDLRIIMLNHAMEKILGYQEQELLGQRTIVLYSSKKEYSQISDKRAKLNTEQLEKPFVVNS